MPTQFRVSFVVDVEADTAQQAAERAAEILSEPGVPARGAYEVLEVGVEGAGARVVIDLLDVAPLPELIITPAVIHALAAVASLRVEWFRDIAPGLSCLEAEALAGLVVAMDPGLDVDVLLAWHARGDDEGDQHHHLKARP